MMGLSLLRPLIKPLLFLFLGAVLLYVPMYLVVTLILPYLPPVIFGSVILLVGGSGAFLYSTLRRGPGQRRRTSGSHGTASWGVGQALVVREGLLIGRRPGDGQLLRFEDEGNLVTVGPTGAGKGRSVVIPNLLEYAGSMFVIDLKPELASVTARRRRELGQDVRIIDLGGSGIGSDGVNPMDFIDLDSPRALDVARALADEIVDDSHATSNDSPHWNEQASGFIAALMLYIVVTAEPEDRHLQYLRELITLPEGTDEEPGPFAKLLTSMMACPAVNGVISREAASIQSTPRRERGSILSSARRHTRFLDSPLLAKTLCRSTFDLADLKRHRTTVFLCLPHEDLAAYFRAIKLVVACALRAIKATPGRPQRRVVFLMEEFQNLGRIRQLERDIPIVRGFGAQVWMIVQDLPRLRSVYPDSWESFLDNAAVLQAFGGSNSKTTLEYLSWLTGDATIQIESQNRSSGRSHQDLHLLGAGQAGEGNTLSETGRRLLLPDEVRRLKASDLLLFVKGMNPLLVRRPDYLTDHEFRGHYDPNPQYQDVSVNPLRSVS